MGAGEPGRGGVAAVPPLRLRRRRASRVRVPPSPGARDGAASVEVGPLRGRTRRRREAKGRALQSPPSLLPSLPSLSLLMANIPVEHKSGTPWWLWLLGLLLLLALIFFLINAFSDDDEEVAVIDPVEEADPIVAPPVTATALDLSNVYVTRVTGDRTFFVAPTEGSTDETLVILDQTASDAPGIEGQVDINPGQRVSLTGGRLEPLGDMSLPGMGLTDADATAIGPDDDVIRVDGTAVEILDAPMGVDEVEVGE